MTQRITDIAEPPMPGSFYLVPTVLWRWYGREDKWPVFLPLHNDEKFLNFKDQHFHIDPRFLTRRQLAHAEYYSYWGDVYEVTQRSTISQLRRAWTGDYEHDPSDVVWSRRKCLIPSIQYEHGDRPVIQAMHAAYAGRQCKRNAAGWICPHQNAALGSMAVVNGVITCPLHGMRIRADDGAVI